MATYNARALARVCCALNICFMVARAAPAVAFPFNSQVPTVARVGHQYSFQLSDSTFVQNPNDLVYSLESQPAWLTFDGATRTLEGTPGQGDVGSVAFTLNAADSTGAAQMPCTLVISSDAAPQLTGDISQQLAATANLSSSEPPVVTLLPSTIFKFDFEPGSFIDIVQRKLYYYATLTDHTPLPSWLIFDSEQLTFTGTAPDLSAFPQSWAIDMIASDVAGFAGTSASFTISIARQRLAFVPEQQDVTITPGDPINIASLQEQLYRDDVQIEPQTLANATASLPSWLEFDSSTLVIDGQAPANATTQNLTVSVTDEMGNSATAIINLILGNASYFDEQIGTIVAHAGASMSYHFEDSLFSEKDLELSVTLPESIDWLHFDAATRDLLGDVPSTTVDTTIKATLLAKPTDSNGSEAQVFTIDIKARAASATSAVATSSATEASGTTSATDSATPSPSAAAESSRYTARLTTGPIVAIVILGVAITAILIAAIVFCCRRRRERKDESLTPQKSAISRPMPSPEPDTIVVTTSMHRDIEKHAGIEAIPAPLPSRPRETNSPPQLAALHLPSQETSRMSRWSKRLTRNSLASSMGMGEEMIKADSNIPEWGRPSAALSAPHDSFSIPAEMARMSRQLSDTSPSKRALHRLRDRNRDSAGTSTAIGRTTAGGIARHSSSRRGPRQRGHRNSLGLSTTRETSSMSSFTTRGTSVLSTQTTLPSEFPRPPSNAISLPTLSILESAKRKSYRRSGIRYSTIRIVARSDSIKDDRPLDEKRQSFIRNRASKSGIQSPLFAHGSRASSSANAKLNGRASTNFSSMGSLRGSRQILKTYSESSSLEPQHHDSRRFSQRVRSAFAPNFPRALTRSTIFQDEDRISEVASSSGFSTTSESINSDDWVNDLPKPRNERNFVLPGEASPTPPPAGLASRRGSSTRERTPSTEDVAIQSWKKRMSERSSSPLSSQNYTTVMDRSSPLGSRSQRRRKSLLGEPQSLVSADSVHKSTRPRLSRTTVRQPVSTEDVQKRLSSMRADQEHATQAQAGAGSEQWEETDSEDDARGAGLMPVIPVGSRTGTQRSDMSGPAFL